MEAVTPPTLTMDLDEVVRLGAVDSEFFCQTFFPKTFRQASPPFSRRIWNALESPAHRLVNVQSFRGSAKTTRLRAFALKRVAYRLSRTVLFLAASEPKASQSIQWVRAQIERNALLTGAFGLEKGVKWHETELEIRSTVDGTTSWIKGAGISSSIRGINFDDYRPDLIILDDVIDDENALTLEGREKITDLILGAIVGSLIAPAEEPNAKLAMLQTPIHIEDATSKASRARSWHTVKVPCWTEETKDLPVELQMSAWPEMFPDAFLRKQKLDAIDFGKLHVFLREYECKLISAETAAFRPALLNFYGPGTNLPDPAFGVSCVSIDPVPPPSDREVAKNLQGKDFEAIVVQTRAGPDYYLREYHLNKGHDPGWTIMMAFQLCIKYKAAYIAVDATAYQATLKWLLEKEMQRRGQYFIVIPDKDHRKKYHKIVDGLHAVVQHRHYHVKKSHLEFITDFSLYPGVQHDDLLDAIGIGLRVLVNPHSEVAPVSGKIPLPDESEYEKLEFYGRCP